MRQAFSGLTLAFVLLTNTAPAAAQDVPVEFLIGGGSTSLGDSVLGKLNAKPSEPIRIGKVESKVFGAHYIALTLPDGTRIEANRDREVLGVGTDITWLGQIRDQPGSIVTFTSYQGAVTGFLHHGAEIYEIRPDGSGNLVIYGVDRSSLPAAGDDVVILPEDEFDDPGAQILNTDPLTNNFALELEAGQPVTPGYVHDLLVVYTPKAKSELGQAVLESAILNAVNAANQAYQNSKIDLRLNLVRQQEIQYIESTSLHTDLERLRKVSDGYMNEVHGLRDQYGADLVALVRWYNHDGLCGMALGLRKVNPYDVDYTSAARTTFSVNSASGGCLSDQTLAHEIGHNQGNAHDRANTEGGGLYPYSYGFRRCVDDGKGFGDIMSYWEGCPGFKRINYFSNPNVSYNGFATGIAYETSPSTSADTARSMNNTAARIQAVRATVTRVPSRPTGLATTTVYSRQLALKWVDNSTEESGYHVERSSDGVNFTEVASLKYNATAYTSTGLTAGTWYWFRVRAYNGAGNSEYSDVLSVRTRAPGESGFVPPLRVLVHQQSYGDRIGTEQQWVGKKGVGLRLEGFRIDMLEPGEVPGVQLEYKCHIQTYGDKGWMASGNLCGYRGSRLRLEGLQMRLTGPAAAGYDVVYYCHVQSYGDRGPYKNGAYCGTKGESRRVESMSVYIVKK